MTRVRLRLSQRAYARAVRLMGSNAYFSATARIVRCDMLNVLEVPRLCAIRVARDLAGGDVSRRGLASCCRCSFHGATDSVVLPRLKCVRTHARMSHVYGSFWIVS
jgi:hypothetical protein